MNRSKDLPKIEDCVKGRLYKLRCRNLAYGVWNGKDGFIGIREKFGDRYLFTEYHHDTGAPYGTVASAIDTSFQVPLHGGYELKESCPTVDSKTYRPCEFKPDDPAVRVPGKWYFKDTGEVGANPCSYGYAPLFDWIESRTKEYEQRQGAPGDDERLDLLFCTINTLHDLGEMDALRRYVRNWDPASWSTHLNVGILVATGMILDSLQERVDKRPDDKKLKSKLELLENNRSHLRREIRGNFFHKGLTEEVIDKLLDGLK